MMSDYSSSSSESSEEVEHLDVSLRLVDQFLIKIGPEDDFEQEWSLSDLIPTETT